MKQGETHSRFSATILRPLDPAGDEPWVFVVLPREASARLPRRGRLTVEGSINGVEFDVLLEPDGQKSHWMKLNHRLLEESGAVIGEQGSFEIVAVESEPEPEIPPDLLGALEEAPAAKATWESTTSVARLDWIHWVTSAKQEKTRKKRIQDACEMLASGKKRVCCFDSSGFYSKAFKSPEPAP